jgi:hypothetical protein
MLCVSASSGFGELVLLVMNKSFLPAELFADESCTGDPVGELAAF